jgi:hypothetical protein
VLTWSDVKCGLPLGVGAAGVCVLWQGVVPCWAVMVGALLPCLLLVLVRPDEATPRMRDVAVVASFWYVTVAVGPLLGLAAAHALPPGWPIAAALAAVGTVPCAIVIYLMASGRQAASSSQVADSESGDTESRRRHAQSTLRYGDRLRVWESDFGRSEGWDIELHGKAVAFMDEAQWEEMFWISYRLTVTTDNPSLRIWLMSEKFWRGGEWTKLTFRSRATGLIAESAFPSATPIVGPQRVSMRGLYVRIGHPQWWDWVVLRARAAWWRLREASPRRRA